LQPAFDSYDVVIVGGGIVGLATGRELLLRTPGLRLVIVEKEAAITSHQSGRNSGVIHSGIYYAPGSLKAKACVAGHEAMLQYCREKGIEFELCGKVIVALDESELPRLNDLYERGKANGVAGLEMIEAPRLREIEPYAAGIRALYSPQTGIVNYKQVACAYADDILAASGEIVTGCRVEQLAPGEVAVLRLSGNVESDQWSREINARFVITCGGLHSDRLAGKTGSDHAVKIVPFRGDYYLLRPEKRSMVRGLIYPVPDPRFPFLGVHFTRIMNGEVWAGPNAVLAFAREGYRRTDFNFKDMAEVFGFRGFWKLAAKYWRFGLTEMYRDYFKAAYVKELQRYMPAIQSDDLLPGPSGIRAQALSDDGRLVDDFLIEHAGNVAHVRNAPSPAATSSLVIARMIADELERSYQFSPVIA
jgi:L-2-hydroxyglutarate oxidase LhgO